MHINFTKYDPKFSLINKKFKIPKNLKEAFFFYWTQHRDTWIEKKKYNKKDEKSSH